MNVKQYTNRIFSWDDRNLFLTLWMKFVTRPDLEYPSTLFFDMLQEIFHADVSVKCRYLDTIPKSIFIDPNMIDYSEKLKPHSSFLKNLVFRHSGREDKNNFNLKILYDVYSLYVLQWTNYTLQKIEIDRLDNFFERMSNMMMNYMILRKKYMKFNIGILDKEVFLRITTLYNV